MVMRVIEELKRHEGFRATPYKDSEGVLTIGYGINLEAGITKWEAAKLLEMRVADLQLKMQEEFLFWPQLSQRRQDVLVNMAYNLGVPGLKKFKRMLRSVEEGNYLRAAEEMLQSKWARQVGSRAVELAEAMRKGGE